MESACAPAGGLAPAAFFMLSIGAKRRQRMERSDPFERGPRRTMGLDRDARGREMDVPKWIRYAKATQRDRDPGRPARWCTGKSRMQGAHLVLCVIAYVRSSLPGSNSGASAGCAAAGEPKKSAASRAALKSTKGGGFGGNVGLASNVTRLCRSRSAGARPFCCLAINRVGVSCRAAPRFLRRESR